MRQPISLLFAMACWSITSGQNPPERCGMYSDIRIRNQFCHFDTLNGHYAGDSLWFSFQVTESEPLGQLTTWCAENGFRITVRSATEEDLGYVGPGHQVSLKRKGMLGNFKDIEWSYRSVEAIKLKLGIKDCGMAGIKVRPGMKTNCVPTNDLPVIRLPQRLD